MDTQNDRNDICASLAHAKNSAKKKTELTSSLKSFLERAGRLTSLFSVFFSLGFFFLSGVRRRVSLTT